MRESQEKLHKIAFKIYIDLVKPMNPIPMKYKKEFEVLYRVLTQKMNDNNKIYSVIEPDVLYLERKGA
jgi:hypothetical protein